MHTKSILNAVNLSCFRQQTCLFKSLHFSLPAGTVLHIEGENGVGKSSLLRLLAGLASPASGEITWNQHAISDWRANYKENMHYIGHSNGIKLALTVTENLQVMARLALAKKPIIEPLLSSLQLQTHAQVQAKYLSAGQRRRLALAKLFLFPRPLWILDEPLTSLDEMSQTFFLARLKEHLALGGISIISSHYALILPDTDLKKLRLGAC